MPLPTKEIRPIYKLITTRLDWSKKTTRFFLKELHVLFISLCLTKYFTTTTVKYHFPKKSKISAICSNQLTKKNCNTIISIIISETFYSFFFKY